MGDALDICDKIGNSLSELGKWWEIREMIFYSNNQLYFLGKFGKT